MTPVKPSFYRMAHLPERTREHFMQTAYLIRDTARALRKAQDMLEATPLSGGPLHFELAMLLREQKKVQDEFNCHFLGQRRGTSAAPTELGVGASDGTLLAPEEDDDEH